MLYQTGTAATTDTWTIWVTSNSTTASTLDTGTWETWYSTSSTTTATTSTVVWDNWNRQWRGASQLVSRNYAKPVETEEQRTERLAREERLRQEAVERRRLNEERWAREAEEKKAAEARAEVLLKEHLDEEQRKQLKERNYFELRTIQKDGTERVYRVNRGRQGNVQQIDPANQQVIRRFCIHPTLQVPDADTMLAQKLMLEHAEEDFIKTANVTEMRRAA